MCLYIISEKSYRKVGGNRLLAQIASVVTSQESFFFACLCAISASISSKDLPRVSGTKWMTKGMDRAAKTSKMAKGPPTLLWKAASRTRKNWETMKLPNQFAADPNELPMPRTLKGKISPINTQAIGPQERAKPRM